jgi:hypothetical protein
VNWALRVVAFSDGVNVMLAALPGARGVSCSSKPSRVGLALPSHTRIHSLAWSPLPGAAVLAVGAGPHVVVVRVRARCFPPASSLHFRGPSTPCDEACACEISSPRGGCARCG